MTEEEKRKRRCCFSGHRLEKISNTPEEVKIWLKQQIEDQDDEPLTERISPEWIRLNLRPAKAKGIGIDDIANWLYESSCIQPLSFTRQNVYNFCVKAYPTEEMKMAAEKVLDEKWLPSHSDAYRAAYKPAYRVLYRDYKKFKKEET